ncbi:MAG TPA: pyridoxamine 5'-phosphate oxidase [Pyrinomonadaceae bacterium]|jgi:pyridoxamine 5'-phosphate oxidase|nr:pyridoxamine 5'-phosphate oxidase [Pyrinomonadaceae bacterium]
MNEHRNGIAVDELDETTVEDNPLNLFQRWFEDAIASGSRLPESMTLATATKDGVPSARVVLLKQVDSDGFVFYTNYHSAKAKDLQENPRAALVFYWVDLDRQVRVEGAVERVPAQESDEYFATRPRESQIGALASPQSEVIESRDVLELRFQELEEKYRDREVERPRHWGGYRLRPDRIEFWQNRPGRLHDRILYDRQRNGNWTIKRLAP